ncbi:hypothetical protein OSW16_06235 [Pseudomonas putida]|uniref:hypothetical protein n=1 Tax=Pseudomonas putida TaxID=303 RepID=UPI00226E994F|nr:hypothetical protein [Pseudomonas putida]WAB99248.1 hypothetical protein OSW16_06235 [Pseudomonas putida]
MLDEEDQPIAGLYAAGELVGNLYYVKYAGGAGLMSGSVMGRIAGSRGRRDAHCVENDHQLFSGRSPTRVPVRGR